MKPVPCSLPMVLLKHTLPDGSHHFDWLLSRCSLEEAAANPDTRDVITLRLDTHPGLWTPQSAWDALDAQLLPDHRRLYLSYEGELEPSGASGPPRGRVERVGASLWMPILPRTPLEDFFAAFAWPSKRWRFSNGQLIPCPVW